MGALTIAFDITIVGALALPWVYLVVHLFFSDGENRIKQALDWVNKHQAQVPAGILLFAMTYTLGSAVSRIAYDFFNDDDIHFQVGGHRHGHVLRWPVTEDRIRARAYCDEDEQHYDRRYLLPNNPEEKADSAMAKEIWDFHNLPTNDPNETDLQKYESVCKQVMKGWIASERKEDNPATLVKIMAHIFGIQENTLMDKGDYSARLRQLHDQIMVLRGAAFSGLIAFSLCLFAWGAILTRKPGSENESGPSDKPRPWLRWTLAVAANVFTILLTAVAVTALYHHLMEESLRFPPDPPYMEFTLLLLAGAGLWLLLPSLLWDSLPPSLCLDPNTGAKKAENARNEKAAAPPYLRIEHWGRLVALSFFLTLAAFLGWWSTEVIYRDQVIYSYDSQFSNTQGSAKPKK
ncbi:MAG: hypothetical protein WBV69_19005 [Candidatus Sulfotelmatobacter sp.]